MNMLLKSCVCCVGLALLASCNGGLAHLNRTYPARISRYEHRNFEELRQQLIATGYYRGYKRSQLHFEACDTKSNLGLYFAVMPGRNTNFNVEIPCLIASDTCLLNGIYFHGKADRDTAKLIASLDSALAKLVGGEFSLTGNFFTKAELDSIRKTFLYGGFIVDKPGYHTHWR